MMFGLERKTRANICSVFKKYPEIEEVIVYGSRAKGAYRKGSDIDLTLMGKGLTESLLSMILVELDDLNTPYPMAVSLFNQL